MKSKQNDLAELDNTAQTIAIDVLTWLAGEPELMGRFLSLTGMTVATLRESSNDAGFFAAILDFLMNHEPTLLAYCESSGTPPETVVRAHHALSGPPGLDTHDL